jgi:AraC-like DNA-binding protein
VTPKWVICRFRLHEALAQLEKSGNDKDRIDWVSFALDLGYFDQSHFIKDFTGMVGCSPQEYHKRKG